MFFRSGIGIQFPGSIYMLNSNWNPDNYYFLIKKVTRIGVTQRLTGGSSPG
jgi:hypothetical protein